jgi:hypothetical protein
MDTEGSNVIRVAFKFLDLFHGIVIEYAESHIVGRGNEPLFAFHKLSATNGKLRDFKRLGQTATFVIPNHHVAGIQCGQHPWFRIVQVHGLDTFGRGR